MAVRLVLLACALTFSASRAPQAQRRAEPHAAPLLYTSAPRYDPLAWLAGGERFPQGAIVFIKNRAAAKPLVPDFFATADANVSFDAKSVLFSGKQHTGDHWQIWEVGVGEWKPRPVTHCADDCIKPFYVPGERAVYARKSCGRFVLEIAALNGKEPALPLTHALSSSLPSDVLRDGRILFTSNYPLDESKTAELYTVYTDGSGVEAYRCDHGHSRHSGKQVSTGDVVFARDGKLYRFTSALAHEVLLLTPKAIYGGDVVETSNGRWIVSSHTASDGLFQLRSWKPGTPSLLLLVGDGRTNIIQPAVLSPRPIPNRHPSALHEWSYANLLGLNAYTSKDHIREGSIAFVRLYSRDAQEGAQVEGTAPVEKDGSFYLRVPGDRPLKIELLDATGKTVKREAGWFWLRSGEQRICVGCHSGPELAPENAVPLVLERSTVAADLTTTRPSQTPAAGGH